MLSCIARLHITDDASNNVQYLTFDHHYLWNKLVLIELESALLVFHGKC